MSDPNPQRDPEQEEISHAAASNNEDVRGGVGGALDPDHPLLARAQRALKKQLESNKQRLDEELRERNIMLNVRRGQRECSSRIWEALQLRAINQAAYIPATQRQLLHLSFLNFYFVPLHPHRMPRANVRA